MAKKSTHSDWLADGIIPESPIPSEKDIRKAASLVDAEFIISVADEIVSLERSAEEVKLWKKDETVRFSRLVELIANQISGQQCKVSSSPNVQVHVDVKYARISGVSFPTSDSKLNVEVYFAIGFWVDEYLIYKHQKESREVSSHGFTITPHEYIERLIHACTEFGRLWAIWEIENQDEVLMWEADYRPLFGNILSLGIKASLEEDSDYHREWLKSWYSCRRELID